MKIPHPLPPARLLERLRLRLVWIAVALVATTAGILAATTLPAWPVVGVAVATLVVAMNTLARQLPANACQGCGTDLSDVAKSEHGSICPSCGQVNQATPMMLARTELDKASAWLKASRSAGDREA